MWGIWILLFAVSLQGLSAVKNIELMHSSTFKIPKLALSDKVEFTEPHFGMSVIIYSPSSQPTRGQVVTSGDHRDYIIKSVNFLDQGTYKVLNVRGSVTSSYKLKVKTKLATTNIVAGETLTLFLEGYDKEYITLKFLSGNSSLRLVEGGVVKVNNLSEYTGRIQVTNKDIKLLNFNVSDVGRYVLHYLKEEPFVVVTANLYDSSKKRSLWALILLGLPLGLCCCCRKKICKCCYEDEENKGVALNPTTTAAQPAPPPGPTPAYHNPAAPSPMYPVIGESTVHPPPNPITPQHPGMVPATNPAIPPSTNPMYPPLYPPAQPPQWSGAPYNAPAGFAPNVPGQMQGPEMAASTPLLPYPQP